MAQGGRGGTEPLGPKTEGTSASRTDLSVLNLGGVECVCSERGFPPHTPKDMRVKAPSHNQGEGPPPGVGSRALPCASPLLLARIGVMQSIN